MPGSPSWRAVLLFFALEQGPAFAAQAAHSTLLGLLSLCFFCLAYGGLARHFAWPVCLALGYAVFGMFTFLLSGVKLPLWAGAVFACFSLGATLALLPSANGELTVGARPRWDLLVRMASTATIVLTLTGLAAWLGPALSGLLTPFPVASTVLVVFGHRQQGSVAAVRVLRGLIGGLFGFVGFCLVLSAMLEKWGIPLAFGAALATAGVIQLALLGVVLQAEKRSSGESRPRTPV